MSAPPEGIRGARGWLEKAEHDLRNAEHTLGLSDDQCPFDTVCFHAQQCVEKCLKALLVQRSVEFPKTHDVVVLRRLVPAGIDLGCDLAELSALNRYAVETRYPGDWDPITRQEAEAAVTVARRVRDLARELTHSMDK
jgi:HEPN domain-containing protein